LSSKKVANVLRFLQYYKIIFTNNKYYNGGNSKKYSLNIKYSKAKTTGYNCTNKPIVKQLNKHIANPHINCSLITKQHQYLYNSLSHISFNSINALNEIKNMLENKIKVLNKDNGKYEEYSQNQFNASILVIDKVSEEIKNQNFTMQRAKNGNRLFTSFTNIPKYIRKFIQIDGKPIICSDLKNSQPLELNFLIDRELKNSFDDTLDCEFQIYKSLTEKGIFYDWLEEKATENGYVKKDNKVFKKQFFEELFFSKVESYQKSIIKSTFNGIFPSIYNLICEIKTPFHNRLAIELQRIEAEIFIDLICKQLASLSGTEPFGQIPVFTIHDAIYCTEDDLDIVHAEILTVFEKLGLKPTLSIERVN
jgi:hypothetical protein